jgi:hypothetical protein
MGHIDIWSKSVPMCIGIDQLVYRGSFKPEGLSLAHRMLGDDRDGIGMS